MRISGWLLIGLAGLGGCASSTGIVPTGPDTYFLSEMRAPAIGGGAEAQRVVLAEASAFCAQQGRTALTLAAGPDGDPYTPYYPTAYTATFACRLPKAGAAAPAQ